MKTYSFFNGAFVLNVDICKLIGHTRCGRRELERYDRVRLFCLRCDAITLDLPIPSLTGYRDDK